MRRYSKPDQIEGNITSKMMLTRSFPHLCYAGGMVSSIEKSLYTPRNGPFTPAELHHVALSFPFYHPRQYSGSNRTMNDSTIYRDTPHPQSPARILQEVIDRLLKTPSRDGLSEVSGSSMPDDTIFKCYPGVSARSTGPLRNEGKDVTMNKVHS